MNKNSDLSASLLKHEFQKSSSPTNTAPNPVPVTHSPSRAFAPSIWDLAHQITAAYERCPDSGARVVSTLDEGEREAFERLVEG